MRHVGSVGARTIAGQGIRFPSTLIAFTAALLIAYVAFILKREVSKPDAKRLWADLSERSSDLVTYLSRAFVVLGIVGATALVALTLLEVNASPISLEWLSAALAFIGAVLVISELNEWASRLRWPVFLLIVTSVWAAYVVHVPKSEASARGALRLLSTQWWQLLQSILIAFLLGHLVYFAAAPLGGIASRGRGFLEHYGFWPTAVSARDVSQIAGVIALFLAFVLQLRVAELHGP